MDDMSDAVAVLMSIVQDYRDYEAHGDALLFAELMEVNIDDIASLEVA